MYIIGGIFLPDNLVDYMRSSKHHYATQWIIIGQSFRIISEKEFTELESAENVPTERNLGIKLHHDPDPE